MRNILIASLLSLACASASAQPALSCEEVDQVGEALTGLGILMDDENAEIGEGSEEDTALRDTVEGLADIAEAEGDQDLADASAQMADAWVDMDRAGFVDGLATAVARLAVIHADECQ